MVQYQLWKGKAPGCDAEVPVIEYYPAERKLSDTAVVIFPGGGYHHRSLHEGGGYAEYLNSLGISAFVVQYRVAPVPAPAPFPAALLDARRGIRFVRANAEKFGINPERLLVMGSSAGGHLAALVSTYTETLEGEGVDEIDAQPYLPNGQILCYPVISCHPSFGHPGSYQNLLGEERREEWPSIDPSLLVKDTTSTAFIWHTSEDGVVNVTNSYCYAAALRRHNIPCEMHIFPFGPHGQGLARDNAYLSRWSGLLHKWLILLGFLDEA